MLKYPRCRTVVLGSLCLLSTPVWAHDPIFGLGPHVLYKGGVAGRVAEPVIWPCLPSIASGAGIRWGSRSRPPSP